MPRNGDARTNPKVFLGKRLRVARISAGFSSQEALAAKLGFDRTVVAKAETGDRVPTTDVLAAWCEACGLDAELYADFAELARSSDGPVPTWFESWLEAEREAQELHVWSPLLIPGLLQTPDYARALFIAAQADTSEDVIDALVSARLERQGVLDGPEQPDAVFILAETVTTTLVGSPEVMRDALIHVASVPGIVVQVVPASIGANAGMSGAFDIARAHGSPDTLRMEGLEDQTAQSRALVRKAAVTFNRVRADALPRDASRYLITEAAERWKTTA